MQSIGFIGPSYTLDSVNVDCQRTVNWFPVVNEMGQGKNREVAALFPTPGLVKLSTAASGGPWRGQWACANGRAFGVAGNTLYEISSAGTLTSRGTLSTAVGYVGMADNTTQLCIVDGLFGYVLTFATNGFAKIADPDFPVADDVVFIDQYIIVNSHNTGQFFLSALADATDWDALDFATAEGSPDNVVRILAINNDLVTIGTDSTETWFNSGDANLPFQRMQGTFIDRGTDAPKSFVKIDVAAYGLMTDPNGGAMVMRLNAGSATRVSTHAIERLINSIANRASATAWCYSHKGHTFYCLNVPGLPTTLCYDLATGLWHERDYQGISRHRAETHCVISGVHLVGDYTNGNLYRLDDDTYTDNSENIACIRITPHASQVDLKRLFFNAVQIDMETGVGNADCPNPQAMLQWSDDGGHTWSNEHWMAMGKVGEYMRRVKWHRLGSSRDRVWKLKITDPVKRVLISEFADVTAGKS